MLKEEITPTKCLKYYKDLQETNHSNFNFILGPSTARLLLTRLEWENVNWESLPNRIEPKVEFL